MPETAKISRTGDMRDALEGLRQQVFELTAKIDGLAVERTAQDPQRRYLNYKEAARYLDTTEAALAVEVSRRRVPFIKRNRRILFDRFSLDRHLAERAVPVEQ